MKTFADIGRLIPGRAPDTNGADHLPLDRMETDKMLVCLMAAMVEELHELRTEVMELRLEMRNKR